MKVLMVGRSAVFADKGGDTMQLVNTARHITALRPDFECEVVSASQLDEVHIEEFDVFHFFSVLDVGEYLDFAMRIYSANKKIVLSPIYVDYSEFESNARGGVFQLLNKLTSSFFQEYAKNIIKLLLGKKKLSIKYIFFGHAWSVKKMTMMSSVVLPNSNSELQRFIKDFGVTCNAKIIPNGIDVSIFSNNFLASNDWDLRENTVICIGRIEGRKNQLNLIYATKDLGVRLMLIGNFAENQKKYKEKVLKAVGSCGHVQLLEYIPQTELRALLLSSKVHVLPSWFETTGLVTLEAASQGCSIVVSNKGDVADYFKGYVHYCDPSSVESISSAIEQALSKRPNVRLKDRIYKYFTWDHSAKETVDAYEDDFFI